jgi:predicted CXXCH cytochrome family protein
MRRFLLAASFVPAIAIGWVLLLPASPVRQPLPFAHGAHADLACTTCHSGAEAHARAGHPDVAAVCAGCHATPPPGASAVLWAEIAEGRPIAWVRRARVPDDVMFSHRRHVAIAGLACASCHIGADSPTALRIPARLNMDACLSCHRQERASADCAACHR